MDTLEKVELIREKTNVSYDDAKVALEASNGDVLDAIIWLERMGKTSAQSTNYSTSAQDASPISPEMEEAQQAYERSSKRVKASEGFSNLSNAFKRLLKKCTTVNFVVERNGGIVTSLPLLVLIFCILWWGAAIPLLIIGLFFGCSYYFEGAGDVGDGANKVMDAMADGVESIKQSFSDDEEQD